MIIYKIQHYIIIFKLLFLEFQKNSNEVNENEDYIKSLIRLYLNFHS